MKEDYFSQLDDYDEPFCEQQYTYGPGLFVSSNSNPLISLIPRPPQILDIRELKQTDAAAERRQSHSNLHSIEE